MDPTLAPGPDRLQALYWNTAPSSIQPSITTKIISPKSSVAALDIVIGIMKFDHEPGVIEFPGSEYVSKSERTFVLLVIRIILCTDTMYVNDYLDV